MLAGAMLTDLPSNDRYATCSHSCESNPMELTDRLHRFALVFLEMRLFDRSVVAHAECFCPVMNSFNYRVKLRITFVEAQGIALRTFYRINLALCRV